MYLTKTLSKKLYLIQYPQRPATVPIKRTEILEVNEPRFQHVNDRPYKRSFLRSILIIFYLQTKMKPTLEKIQVTLGVETESEFYDEFHGELLAEAAEGLGLNEDEYIP